jgi:AcrR family transcriptional regulator
MESRPGIHNVEHDRKVGRRRRGRPEARERLLEAGIQLLGSEGVGAINSNHIARAAGVGIGTFYAHFEDKHDLHRALVAEAVDALQASLARAAAAAGEDPSTQVRALVTAVVDFAVARPGLFKLAFGRSAPASSPGRPVLGLSTRASERRLAELKQQGRLDPALDPELAARAFAAMQNGLLLWWLDEQERVARDTLIETLVRMHPALAAQPA